MSTADVLKELLRAEWRGVGFFASGFSFGFDHQHVQHLYPDRDAGFIEATGRNPAVHSFQVLFRNGNLLAPEVQYPVAWRKMVAACLNRSTGTLLHPELGPLKVKCKSLQTTWDFKARDGVDLNVEFVETTDAEDELVALFNRDAAYTVEFVAGALDDAKVGAMVKDPDPLISPSLLESIKKLTGAIASAQASLGNINALVESYANAIGDLTDKIEEANEPSDAGIIASLKLLYANVLELPAAARPKVKPVTLVLVTRDATMAAVASAFDNKLEDLLALNPALGTQTSLKAGEPVMVYAA